jgi:putative ABC transport system permease protein
VGSSVVDLGPRLAVVLVALTALAAVAGRLSGLGQDRPVVVAALRATVQLTAVSAVLLVVVRSLPLSALFVLLMVGVAAVTAASRATGLALRSPGTARRVGTAAAPVLAGAVPVVSLVLAGGTVPLRGEAVIPIAGILVGGAMTATSLAGRRLREELAARRGEVEAALALGLLQADAVREVLRPAAATALVPPLDQTRTVGLVTLPAPSSGYCWRRHPAGGRRGQLLVLVGPAGGAGHGRVDGGGAGGAGPAAPGRPPLRRPGTSQGPTRAGSAARTTVVTGGRCRAAHEEDEDT